MNDTDLLKDLLETEQAAKSLVDEAQKKADVLLSHVRQEKQKEYNSRIEEGTRARDRKIESFKTELENKKTKEIEDYRSRIRTMRVNGELAFEKLRELLKDL